jgi:hypothetical protein
MGGRVRAARSRATGYPVAMMLALVSLAAAMELRLSITSPEGHVGTVTTTVNGDTVLTRYPLPVLPKVAPGAKPGKQKYTALVSATMAGEVCTVDVEVYKGDLRKNKTVLQPRLVLTSYESSFVENRAGTKSDAIVWQVAAAMSEDFDLTPDLAMPGWKPTSLPTAPEAPAGSAATAPPATAPAPTTPAPATPAPTTAPASTTPPAPTAPVAPAPAAPPVAPSPAPGP